MRPRHPKEGFRGDGVFFHTMHVQVAITGRGNNLKDNLNDNPSDSSGGVYIILEVC